VHGLLIQLLPQFLVFEHLQPTFMQLVLEPLDVLGMLKDVRLLRESRIEKLTLYEEQVLHPKLHNFQGLHAFAGYPDALLLIFEVAIGNVIDVLFEYLIYIIE
jgi:hypothetical protein